MVRSTAMVLALVLPCRTLPTASPQSHHFGPFSVSSSLHNSSLRLPPSFMRSVYCAIIQSMHIATECGRRSTADPELLELDVYIGPWLLRDEHASLPTYAVKNAVNFFCKLILCEYRHLQVLQIGCSLYEIRRKLKVPLISKVGDCPLQRSHPRIDQSGLFPWRDVSSS
jgi:hypothetical protein